MMPMYRYPDSYPMNGNQLPSNQNYYPSFDPSKSVVFNQPWPYANNFGHPGPCYTCYGQSNFPACYGYRPCSYFPPPQFHHCGYHPPFPDSYPVHYVSPNNMSELPRYEFDKLRDNSYHCCGCPNHSHDQRKGDSVKIEEQEHDGEKLAGESLVPFQLKNYPYPVLWIPPEYTKNKELEKPKESDLTGGKKLSQVMRPAAENVKSPEQDPSMWNGWLPIDVMKRLRPILQDNDGRNAWDQKNEDNRRQFPFPIIWMSPNDKQSEAEKEEHEEKTAPEPAEEQRVNKPHMTHESSGEQSNLEPKEKVSKQKIIPVKQMEAPLSDDFETAQRKEDGKASGASAKGQPLSPSKKSKLPPVCLRVDPLPRKRNGKTNSRSPSPPGSKEHPHETIMDTPNVSISSSLKAENDRSSQIQECTLSCSKEPEAKKSSGIYMEAVEGHNNEKKDELQSGYQSNLGKETSSSVTEKDKILSNADGPFSKVEEKKLSAEEAALRIQSVYRGFEVRKWEPLKKLKQIAKVEEQVVDVRNKISDLESSLDLQKDEKQKAIIGEMIMNLLLKLDAIQGLHPNLRDLRKSVARELVTLQEKLDLLFIKPKSLKEPSIDPNSNDIKGGLLMDVESHQDHGVSNQDKETLKPSLAKEEKKLEKDDDLPEAGNLESHFKCPEDTASSGELPSSEVLTMENCIPCYIEQVPSERNDPEEMAGGQLENKFHQNNEVQVEPVETNTGNSQGENIPEVSLEGLPEKESVPSAKEEGGVESSLFNTSALPVSTNSEDIPDRSLLEELPIGAFDDESDNQENEVTEHDPSIDALEQQPMESCREWQVTTDGSLLDKEAPALREFELEPPVVHEGLTETEVPLPDKEVPNQCLVEGLNFEAEDNICQLTARDEHKDGADEHNELKESESNMVANQANNTETSEKETAVVVSAASQPSVEKQEMEIVRDRKLIEENEKMRLMVEKLLESGKQQLAVISNLTGRVKDLEKKLSKRKARARRCRKASSKSASTTGSSKPRNKTDATQIAV